MSLPACYSLVPMDDARSQLLQRQAKRYQFLYFVFVESSASEMQYIADEKIKQALGLTPEEFTDIVQYLRGEYLLGSATFTTTVISHRGIVEMEESILNPQRPTEHFASIVIQNFNGPVYGGVQTAGENNTQLVALDQRDDDEAQ